MNVSAVIGAKAAEVMCPCLWSCIRKIPGMAAWPGTRSRIVSLMLWSWTKSSLLIYLT